MLITFLDDLKDHRRSQGQRYELRFIILFSVMAILSNARNGKGYPVGVAVDGKVLRGSYDHFQDQKATQVLSFFDTEQELNLAHETIDVKTNEILVAQVLIPRLGLEGIVYTPDALHCPKKTFEAADNENPEEKKTDNPG
ncbi:MAG: hypothetical protein ACK5HT_16560 [Draconibacterium sp.]